MCTTFCWLKHEGEEGEGSNSWLAQIECDSQWDLTVAFLIIWHLLLSNCYSCFLSFVKAGMGKYIMFFFICSLLWRNSDCISSSPLFYLVHLNHWNPIQVYQFRNNFSLFIFLSSPCIMKSSENICKIFILLYTHSSPVTTVPCSTVGKQGSI